MQKWIHIAGIAGKSTSNTALMYKQMGYFVTGSDNNCLPPATDLLDKYQIPYIDDYSFRHLTKEFWETKLNTKLDIPDVPDRTVFVATLTQKNKEYLFAKAHGIKIQTMAQALGEDLVKKESIVSVGTAGKTTSTALLIHILSGLEFEPSYMLGGEFADGRTAIKNNPNSPWSILEGDEFYGVNLEPHSKFFEYKPKYLILNKIEWDHADVFATEQIYIDNFARLLHEMPASGLVIANAGDANIRNIAHKSRCKVVWFNAYDEVAPLINDEGKKLYWHLNKLEQAKLLAIAPHNEFELEFTTRLIGKYNEQNCLAVIALLYELFADTIDWHKVQELIASFQGIEKRLQILHADERVIVIDDLGGPPLKVRSGLEALYSRYKGYNTIVVYEPNSGNRKIESINSYRDAFPDADLVIIPTLSEYDTGLLGHDQLVAEMQKLGIRSAVHVPTEKINEFIKSKLQPTQNLIMYSSSYRLTALAREFVRELTN